MRNIQLTICFFFSAIALLSAQEPATTYQKKVLENVEVALLMSYYQQDGSNAAVTGGIGTEKLTDITPTIVLKIPLNANDVLTADIGISAYTSASSSNLDPFDASGASGNGDDDDDRFDDDDDDDDDEGGGAITGTPWLASSGASKEDIWFNSNIKYSHSSDDRNTVVGGNVSFSQEYDYVSVGFGANILKLYNEKNTEIGLSTTVYLDTWKPKYPTEIDSYLEVNGDLNDGFFATIDILDQNGLAIDKDGPTVWAPHGSGLIPRKDRKTFSASFSFSQILSKNAQISFFVDFVKQEGWLANPMQRVYFSDKANYYVGNGESISMYTSPTNTDVFHLADDIERLPTSRVKIPIGTRFNYYINENLVLRSYYRYYTDNWGIAAHTIDLELPIKWQMGAYTVYPSYRYYTQTAATYFAGYNQHLSTSEYYTSDYDLSQFKSQQYGLGFKYTDIFGKLKIFKFGLKSVDFRYSYYHRTNGLQSGIVSTGLQFVMD